MHSDPAYYARILRYDDWANAETLRSLQEGDPPAKALRWMGHIIGASALWLSRLQAEPAPMAVWPELDLEQCARGLDRLAEAWPRYLEPLAPPDLERGISYRNSQGEDWTSTVGDILTHVGMHGAYHRAQIAAAVRASGRTPAYTDFIHAVRQGLVR